MGNILLGWQASRIYNSEHISPLSTTGSTTTRHHRTSPLTSLNPLAPAFLPSYQSSSNPPILLCNSTKMGFPLAQLLSGMPPQTVPSHAPSINQHLTDGTFLLSLLQQTNQSKPDAAVHQPTPESLALLPSLLQHQLNCLQAINKTIKQFNQHLKAEQLDRQTLQLILLQLQNYFVLLRFPTSRSWWTETSTFYPGGRCGTTHNQNKRYCKRWFPAPTQHAGSSFNYGAEPHIKNLQTGKFVCRRNISLHIHHCGDPLPVFLPIW